MGLKKDLKDLDKMEKEALEEVKLHPEWEALGRDTLIAFYDEIRKKLRHYYENNIGGEKCLSTIHRIMDKGKGL